MGRSGGKLEFLGRGLKCLFNAVSKPIPGCRRARAERIQERTESGGARGDGLVRPDRAPGEPRAGGWSELCAGAETDGAQGLSELRRS